jgi:flagellar protein FlgJ
MTDLAAPVSLLRSNVPITPAPTAAPKAVRKAAEDFEASFLSAILQPMFDSLSTEAPFGGGDGEKAYKSFLIDAFSKQTVKAGGIGLADTVQREMLKMQGAA